MSAAADWPKDDAERIRRALATDGGHLGIGRGNYTLYYARGARLSGYDVERMKADCIAAGLPVIDSRQLDFGLAITLACRSPLIAVGEPPDPESSRSDPPEGQAAKRPEWHALAHAPLQHVAGLYRAAGAEVVNLPAG